MKTLKSEMNAEGYTLATVAGRTVYVKFNKEENETLLAPTNKLGKFNFTDYHSNWVDKLGVAYSNVSAAEYIVIVDGVVA